MRPEDELRLLRAVVEETPLVIYAKDIHRRFVLSNRMHSLLIDQPPTWVLGQTDTDIFGPAAADVEATTERVMREGVPVASEYTLPIAGEARTYLETIFPLHDERGEVLGAGGIATDITPRLHLERALKERARELEAAMKEIESAHAELLQKEKLAALGPLVAAVAHEVNTPIGVALTSVTVIDDRLRALRATVEAGQLTRGGLRAALDELGEASRLATDAIERAARLVRSFKQVAVDRNTPELRTAQLSTWLQEIGDSLRPMARQAGVALEFELGNDAQLVFAAGELQQVVTNLVVNALVHAFPTAAPGRRVNVSVRTAEGVLDISVVDNGVGMPPEVAARAFEPFFTTRRGEGGSGLGLHIANSIVSERFAGVLCLDSQPGVGTGVHIRIPLDSPALSMRASDA